MKRFYKMVSTKETGNGYEVLLDDRSVKTPAKNTLTAPSKTLADFVMQEWARQEDQILPDTMPLTQILSTKIDRVSQEREAMTAALLKYLDTDLICYHTDDPPELEQKQKEAWQPWLDWFKNEFGSELQTTSGLTALSQSPEAHEAVQTYVTDIDDDKFTALGLAVPLCGSLVLGLAFTKNAITADDAFAAARVEERFKADIYDEEKYGPDPAQEKKDKAALADLQAAENFLKAL